MLKFYYTRNKVFALTLEVRVLKEETLIESRKSEEGEDGVTNALLKRITTLRSKQEKFTFARQTTDTLTQENCPIHPPGWAGLVLGSVVLIL